MVINYGIEDSVVIEEIKKLIGRYEYETNNVYSPREYVIYSDENIELFREYFNKKKDNPSKYSECLVRVLKKANKELDYSTMEIDDFYQKCISILLESVPYLDICSYLDSEEIENYNKINKMNKQNRLSKNL